ncbi:hypothetical protein CEP51_010234 [Fusarium floridanum]|uniref:LIM zinc-binding domain-containing protein n=1 Tax=Fusarium floridanum TaxID=1325733 RepID=A0A428RF20_9HYPO|nr:hypothetical protein CEP51_010234 [Fusarium floridanum]
MDPLSIAASVGALAATCLSTCKKLSDLASNYQDVPMVITMICSETMVINIALSDLQKNILQRQDLSQAWASRTDVLVAFETALTGCMIVFSCLEAETRRLQSQTLNSSGMRVWAKLKFLWNQDRLKELLSALRGQQSSINFLIQVLGINTLSDIERNIRDNKSKIQNPASEAQSLRSNNPSVKMESQSIFDSENTRLSLFDTEAISAVAPSELDFDFDDMVLNSQAYRRAFARAESAANLETRAHVTEDIDLSLSNGSTIRRVNRELVDLNLATTVESSSLRRVSTVLGCQESIPEEADNPPPEREEESLNLSQLMNCPEPICEKCSGVIIGQFVRDQGKIFHPDCFTCADCGETIRTKFFRLKHDPRARICENDYFQRLDQLHHKCEQGLEDINPASGNKNYHVKHFTHEMSLTDLDANTSFHDADFADREENDAQVCVC